MSEVKKLCLIIEPACWVDDGEKDSEMVHKL